MSIDFFQKFGSLGRQTLDDGDGVSDLIGFLAECIAHSLSHFRIINFRCTVILVAHTKLHELTTRATYGKCKAWPIFVDFQKPLAPASKSPRKVSQSKPQTKIMSKPQCNTIRGRKPLRDCLPLCNPCVTQHTSRQRERFLSHENTFGLHSTHREGCRIMHVRPAT